MRMDEEFDLKRQTDHWTSYLFASIAGGSLRDGVSRMIQHFCDRETRKMAAREEGPIRDERPTLSIFQAAEILRISRSTAYSMAREGKLPIIRLGRRILVTRKGLNELLSRG